MVDTNGAPAAAPRRPIPADGDAALSRLADAVAALQQVDAVDLAGRADAHLIEQVLAAAVTVVGASDDHGLSDGGLCDLAVGVDRQVTRLQAETARLLTAVHTRQAYQARGCVTTASWWRHATRRDHARATRFTRTATRLRHFPQMTDALAAGEITYDHAEAVCDAAIPQRRDAICRAESTLLRLSRKDQPRAVRVALRRIADTVDPDGSNLDHTCEQTDGADPRRELYLSHTYQGLWDLRGTLDPVTGERLFNLLDATSTPDAADLPANRRRSSAQRRHDALDRVLKAAEQHPDLPAANGATPHVLITFDLMQILGAPQRAARTARLGSGIDITADKAIRLLLAGKVSPVAMWGPFRPVAFGRTRRVLPNWLRPVLQAVHGHCRGPGCDRPARWTQAAHLTAWHDNGPTELDLTIPACHAHHRLMDRAGWQVHLDPDTAEATWTSPDNATVIRTRPPPP